ncbi:contact-dependent growth inhibition system immunity protein [Haemophilus parainfluenzae]|uniref:DUF1436 family protein n=1 Tax=Haemophilus parainfluenzae TaxID=729 RepID=A0AB36ILA7_HAEPA|nr:contact-dependent growth inhibition system immunity protein [Haemophilus parainfluenzae]OLV24955.1 hypothetical protein BSO15_08990 [Haemophilus parainfluenzae]OLV29020.1 hypothetical protein BSN92_02385 [Haemophilus parainfluenzae]
MSKSKSIFIEVNCDFILVTSLITGMLSMVNPDQDFIFNEVDISDLDLGRLIKEKLNESKEISFEEFQAIFNSEKMEGLQKNLEEEMKKHYGYKNKKSIYKDMSSLSLEQDDLCITISPLHQDSLDGSTGISLPDNSPLEFKYDKNISDEELGKAIRQALTYCTSIYR